MQINVAYQSHIAHDVPCRPTSRSDTDAAYDPWRQPLVLEMLWPDLDKEDLSPMALYIEPGIIPPCPTRHRVPKNIHSCQPDQRVSRIVGNRHN